MKVKIRVKGLDITINVRKFGSAKETNLLMVHGIPTNALLWRHTQKHLKHYTSYAMDMVGYGESSMPLDRFNHTLNNQAEAVKAVIEALDLKGKVTLVGHDHGGGVAQIVASKYGQHIHRLVLVNPVSFDYWPVLEVEAIAGLVGASDEALKQMAPQMMGNFGALLRMGSSGSAFTDQNVKQNYLRFWARGPGLSGIKSLIKICSQPTNSETLDIDYAKIKCPTLICWGVNDAWMPKEAATRIKAQMQAPTRVQFIERAGHYVLEDRPDEIAWYIEDFLTEWQSMP